LTQRGRSIGNSKTSVSERVDHMVTVLHHSTVAAGSERRSRYAIPQDVFRSVRSLTHIFSNIIFGGWNFSIAADAVRVAEYFESRPARDADERDVPHASAMSQRSADGCV
jgi:hypothetical protein